MWVILSIIWGFSEATLFFIIPDVLLTRATLSLGWRGGIRLALIAAIASTVGAGFMVQWGANDPAAALAALDHVPAISPGLIDQVDQRLEMGWRAALFWGGFQGQPVKIFAVLLGKEGIGWGAILPIMLLARFTRFLVAVSVAKGLQSLIYTPLPPEKAKKAAFALWILIWAIIYVVYFSIFGF